MKSVVQPVYNSIGKTYDVTRKADPGIAKQLMDCLKVQAGKVYLDVGCGSGNYTGALSQQGVNIEGTDISADMLAKAYKKYPNIKWHEGDARKLPLQSGSYDGAICVLATQHIKDIDAAFKEIYRVINQGRFVIFTATPEQHDYYWLREFFPKMIDESADFMTGIDKLSNSLLSAGFKNIQAKPYSVTKDLQDLFLYSGKYRPEIYLDPAVRAGISSFHLFAHEDEITLGLVKLKENIHTGKINEIIKQYETPIGDYTFVVAEK